MKIIDWTGNKMKPWKPSKADQKRMDDQNKKYPWDFTVYISYAGRGKTSESALTARNEIEKKLSVFGSWVGHGTDMSSREHDVQVGFKNEKDIEKARKIAVDIMFKHGVSGHYNIYNTRKDARPKAKRVVKRQLKPVVSI
jgi:hypothetical protein